ncbi:MAG: T9SS type A sorting domain-containing protein [Sphingobacteriales bacterium]|nr:T9SS type A sorting domain-containing protein [Sphingobacteriales bacterium]
MKLKNIIALPFLVPVMLHAQGAVKINSGTYIFSGGNAIIVLQDINLSNDGTINQLTGNSSFKFTGIQNNTISGLSAPLFDILEMAKTGSAKISLQRGINIGSTLKFTSGLLDLNNNILILSSNGVVSGETETSWLTGATGGYIQIVSTLNAPSAANPGNLGAVITSTQNLGSTIIKRGHVSQTDLAIPGFSINRYYDISPATNTNLNATLRINYFDAELNGKTEAGLSMWKSTDKINWAYAGFSNRNAATNFVETNTIASFSRCTLSDKIATGIFDLPSGRNSLHIWPNPYTEWIIIEIESTKPAKASLKVYDILGKLVYAQPLLIILGKNKFPVRLATFAQGLYQVKITDGEGSVAVIPIVKQ